MRPRTLPGLLALGALALGLVAACKGPAVPNPLNGQTRYLCCNLHYEKPHISDVNFQQGALIPFGTQVRILEVRGDSVKFEAAGNPPIQLDLRYGRKFIGFDQYLDRVFVTTDPRTHLKKVPAKVVKLIEQGSVEPGMTREQVLMALGYPPAHRTPNLDAPEWHYWQNRWHQFVVYFDGDKVSRIQS